LPSKAKPRQEREEAKALKAKQKAQKALEEALAAGNIVEVDGVRHYPPYGKVRPPKPGYTPCGRKWGDPSIQEFL
jgi:hypothetical protein